MNRTETMKVMAYIFAEHEVELTDNRIDVWCDQFGHLEFETAMQAAKVLLSRKTFGIPKAADLAEVVRELTATKQDRETWGEAWDIVRRICGSHWINDPNANVLARIAAESPRAAAVMRTSVRELMEINSEDIPNFRAQFRQRYEALQERDERDGKMPPMVQEALEDKRRPEGLESVGSIARRLVEDMPKKDGVK